MRRKQQYSDRASTNNLVYLIKFVSILLDPSITISPQTSGKATATCVNDEVITMHVTTAKWPRSCTTNPHQCTKTQSSNT